MDEIVPVLPAAWARPVFWLLASATVALLIMIPALRTSRRPLTGLAR